MNTFQLDLGNLQINLSDEKLFVNTFASNETFALRSVNGLGVIDLIDDFSKTLKRYKMIRLVVTLIVSYFFIEAAADFNNDYDGNNASLVNIIFLFFCFCSPILIFKFYTILNPRPILMSAVRIMLNGGNRDFQFDKAGVDSEAIAEFVARVESTLTAYHKKD